MSEVERIQQLRIGTIVQQEADRILKRAKCPIGSSVMPERLRRSNITGEQLSTNVYQLSMESEVKIYRYRVQMFGITGRNDSKINLTGASRYDFEKFEHREQCRSAFIYLSETRSEIFCKKAVYYDLASLMFGVSKFDIPQERITFNPVGVEKLDNFKEIEVEFEDTGTITIGSLVHINNNVGELDLSLQQFMNIATCQNVFKQFESYMTFTASDGYMYDPVAYQLIQPNEHAYFESNSTYLGYGFQKSVRVIEDGTHARPTGMPGCEGTLGLVVGSKKSPFHLAEPVYEKARKFLRLERLNNLDIQQVNKLDGFLKGIMIELSYRKTSKKIVIHGISARTPVTEFIEGQRGRMSVQQYYSSRYNIHLEHPTSPMVEAKEMFQGSKKTNVYPMELCIILDNQRAKTHQQTPDQVQQMIRKCAVPPVTLSSHIEKTTRSLGLENDRHLRPIKVNFNPEPITVKSSKIPAPDIRFGARNEVRVGDGFTWKGRGYNTPATINIWAAYAFTSNRSNVAVRDFESFTHRLYKEMYDSGIQLQEPAEVKVLKPFESTIEKLKGLMEFLQDNHCEFVYVAHPDADDDMHHALKYYERLTGVVTQGIKISTIGQVVKYGKHLTAQNIIHKTNVKNGGLNYTLAPNTHSIRKILSNTLVIGFAMNQPAGDLIERKGEDAENGNGEHGESSSLQVPNGSPNGNGNGNGRNGGGRINGNNGNGENGSSSTVGGNGKKMLSPSLIGFSANFGQNPFAFCGDYAYQEQRRDSNIAIISSKVLYCVKRYVDFHKNPPESLIVYRNGCSEGQFDFILKYEIPLIKKKLEAEGLEIPLTYIIPNKLQAIRFFRQQINSRMKAYEQNIQPGTVIDSGIVHPCYTEFYLAAHRALQGTSKVPRYTVLQNSENFTLEQLEEFTYALCYGHQIVYSPTSLPTPVYVAEEYAKRGRNIYNNWLHDPSSQQSEILFDELTEILCHQNSESLCNKRVNA